jgi:hypothetical protein
VVGQRKGPSGANAPPVHGIKKCLEFNPVKMPGICKKFTGQNVSLKWPAEIASPPQTLLSSQRQTPCRDKSKIYYFSEGFESPNCFRKH